MYNRLGIWHLDLTHKIKTSPSWTLKLSFSLLLINHKGLMEFYVTIFSSSNICIFAQKFAKVLYHWSIISRRKMKKSKQCTIYILCLSSLLFFIWMYLLQSLEIKSKYFSLFFSSGFFAVPKSVMGMLQRLVGVFLTQRLNNIRARFIIISRRLYGTGRRAILSVSKYCLQIYNNEGQC